MLFCFDKFINELQKSSSSSGVKLYYIVFGNKIILLFSFERFVTIILGNIE